MNNDECYYGGHLGVYHSKDGISINTGSSSYIMNEVIVIENKKNIKLRAGSNNKIIFDNYLTNAYINSYALGDTCPDCYNSDRLYCKNTDAM
mmetsp:Transcript_14986/g.1352  ORF Transcript_14986/g.1352 Transcript_14986/m.1352 type:complete len:92 (-) Transcript_14986:1793-2068(-)